jgi:hypothetical protein
MANEAQTITLKDGTVINLNEVSSSYEDAKLFANIHEAGNISDSEYNKLKRYLDGSRSTNKQSSGISEGQKKN